MRFASSSNQIRKKIQDYSYGLNDLIGKGFSSSVFKGMNQRTREQVAIKVIDLKSIRDRSKKQMLQGQIEALKKLNHNNIMKCHDIYSTQNNCYIITQFCNEGDLENLLKKRQKLPQSEAIPIFRDIVNGFRVIAQSGFLHRDLKPANILMKDKVAKIADFGFAKKVTNNPRDQVNVGSPLYMSPQSLKYNIYTVKNDIWSLGIILYQILHGKTPWKATTQQQLKQKMTKQTFTMGGSFSEDLKDFIRKCLNSQQSKRLGLIQFYNHPFIVRITQDDGIPQLLRKQTSINEKIQQKQFKQQRQPRQLRLQKQKSLKQIKQGPGKQLFHPFHNISENPTNIHHRKNHHIQENRTQKQLNSQLNFMRFLFRFISMFPAVQQSGRFTLGLRFLSKKLMLSQLYNLKKSISKQNIFNFDNWDQFVSNSEKQLKYQQILDNYSKKYQSVEKQLNSQISIIGKDKTISSVVDTNYQRSEALSILGINYSIAECKSLLNQLKKVPSADAFKEQHSKKAMRLDFTITFYQLNSMLIDNFTDLDYFTRQSKVEYIIEYKPTSLDYNNIKQLEQKMMALQIVR